MSCIQKIMSRNSNPLMQDKPIPVEMLRMVLDAAVCTPVHYATDPWRFLVLQKEARVKFGEFLSERAKTEMSNPEDELCVKKLERIKSKPLRAPVIIVVAAARSTNEKAKMVEDVASANVACQNILLAADELGLAAIWRTGAMAYADDVVEYLGFDKGTKITGFIYLGYPVKEMKPKNRKTHEAFTRWEE